VNQIGIGISGISTGAEVHENNIFGNINLGLNNDTGNFVDAENNWWGPGGTGGPGNVEVPPNTNNGVVGNVDSSGWSKVKF
jgi:hypothetical protein